MKEEVFEEVKNIVLNYKSYGGKKLRRRIKLSWPKERIIFFFIKNAPWKFQEFYYNLSEEFIRHFEKHVDWNLIFNYKENLSEQFLTEFKCKPFWYLISYTQHLSENFIRKYKDDLDWISLTRMQNMSLDFIREHANFIDWEWVCGSKIYNPYINNKCKTYELTPDFVEEFKSYLEP